MRSKEGKSTGFSVLAVLTVVLFAAGTVTAQSAHQGSADDSAQKVSIDPQTKKLRAPTAEEAKKLSEGMNLNRVPENVKVTPLPQGGVMAELPEEYMDATVATIDENGKVKLHCVTGAKAADALVEQSTQKKDETKPAAAAKTTETKPADQAPRKE
jgi:hypothetical protein